MDKYELNIKLEQMRKLIKRKEYNTAAKIADTIEWNRIRNNQDLLMAADIYEASGKLVNAREVLLYAYERTNLGRQIVYRLCRVATKLGDIVEAEEFYAEFVRMAVGDNSRYILQYEIARAKGAPLETQIAILSKYLDEEMDDKWAYELAKLYHKANKGQDCAKMCDTIILWFSDGKYVDKALELKSLYAPLTKEQQSRVFKESIIPVIDRTEEVEDAKMVLNEMQGIKAEEIQVKDYSNKVSYDTMNIQRELAESMKDLFDEEFDEPTESDEEVAENEGVQQMSYDEQMVEAEIETPEDLEKTKEVNLGTTKVFTPISKQMIGEVEDEVTEQVETVSEMAEITDELIEAAEDGEQMEIGADIPADMEELVSEENAEAIADEAGEELEEPVDEDHIEGQLTIDEVLAMFNLDVDDVDEGSVGELADAMGISTEETEELELEDILEDIAEDVTDEEVAEESVEEALEKTETVEETAEIGEAEVAEEAAEEENIEAEPVEEVAEEVAIEETEETAEEPEEVEEQLEEAEQEETVEEVAEEIEEEPQEEALPEYTEEEVVENAIEDTMEESVSTEENIVEDGENMENEEKPFTKRNLIPEAKQELKDFISRFTGVKGIDKQILKAMHSVLKTSADESNFIFIIGDVKSGKTTLAIDMIKVLNKIMENRGRKIAKVPGSSLSGKNMEKFMDKVVESDIVVEKVSSMGEDSLKELVEAVRNGDDSKIVIFEDEVITSEKFVREICEQLNVGDNIIVLKQSRIKEWAEIALEYIKEEGYEIDEMGVLAMHERIDKLHALTLVIQKNHVEQVIDRAITKHNKRKLSNLFKGSKSNVLTEKDFIED